MKAFTLVELMVAITIIAILWTILFASITEDRLDKSCVFKYKTSISIWIKECQWSWLLYQTCKEETYRSHWCYETKDTYNN